MSLDAQPIPVVVTGVGGGGVGSQILKALRRSELEYEIHGCDITAASFGLDGLEHTYVVPRADDPAYIDTVLEICRKAGAKVLFYGSEAELWVLSTNRQRFADAGIIVPLNPAHVIDICADKVRTAERLAEMGFAVPEFRSIENLAQIEDFPILPAVLKPATGSGGSANVLLAQDRAELRFFASYLLENVGPFIVQAYVGTPEHEYTVGVMHDLDGNFVNSIAVRRHIGGALSNLLRTPNRSGRPELGPILMLSNGLSQGDIGRFPEVTGPCEKIADQLGVTGPVNIQIRLVGDTVYVFEINPRFSGTTNLRAMVGYNEPDMIVRRHVLGQQLEVRFPYESATILRGLEERRVS